MSHYFQDTDLPDDTASARVDLWTSRHCRDSSMSSYFLSWLKTALARGYWLLDSFPKLRSIYSPFRKPRLRLWIRLQALPSRLKPWACTQSTHKILSKQPRGQAIIRWIWSRGFKKVWQLSRVDQQSRENNASVTRIAERARTRTPTNITTCQQV